MRTIKLFEEFISSDLLYGSYGFLYESTLNAAKSYMEKIYAKNQSIELKDLTQDQKFEALKNPGYQEIRKMLEEKNAFGYALPFVKFHFEQRIPIGRNFPTISEVDLGNIRDLKTLLVVLTEKKNIVGRLPLQLNQYAGSEKIGGVDGFEALCDAIRTIEREDSAKWLFERLPRKAREEYRNATKEEKDRLINAAVSLGELGEKVSERFLSKIKAFSDWGFSQIMDQLNKFLSGYKNIDIAKKMEEVAALEPEAGILFHDDGYLVLSMRTEDAQKKLCSIANWCINRGSWSSYAGKSGLQINIFDYNRELTDNNFLIGTTINYEGYRVRASHDVKDHSVLKSNDPREHFTRLGYPKNLVDELINLLPIEVSIKKVLDEIDIISTGSPKQTTEKIIKFLLGLDKGRQKDIINQSSFDKMVSTVLDILETGSKVTKNEILNHCKEYGLVGASNLRIFDLVFKPGEYTNEDIQQIYDSTVENLENIEFVLNRNKAAGKSDKAETEIMKKIVEEGPKTLSDIKRKME